MSKGNPTPPTSPWTFQAVDYQGAVISISVPFDTTTGTLQGATVFRDDACVYQHVYIGLGPDGTPNTTTGTFAVPAGTTSFTAAQLRSVGLKTYTDISSVQVTAGP